MPKLAVDSCDICQSKLVPCIVIPAGLLPKESICKGCDKTGMYIRLSTYKK